MVEKLKTILLKYKVLHVIMWMLVGCSTFFTYYEDTTPLIPQVANAGMVIICSTIPFYITAYVLIPKTLYKHRYFLFIFLLILLDLFSGIFMMLAVRSVDHFFDPSRPVITADLSKLRFAANIFIWTSLIASFGAGGLKIMSDSFKLRKKLLEVEKEKISTELNFLRSQINPHFLFNVINTIYFQIDKQNTHARASVEKLSEMLRYQLYECTTDKIEIAKELDYIKSYVAIQTLRMEKGSDIQLCIDEEMNSFRIAPLLILPIVENAFKHVSHFKDPAQNKIHISLAQNDIHHFIIKAVNTFDEANRANHLLQSGGLGVQNLKRRLELLYPNRYELQINQHENLYQTTLKLQHDD
ncbi:MAG TPA: histidine kinase [Panacibacter sp.]|nr:histidine kinase [Panacibacter sp.]